MGLGGNSPNIGLPLSFSENLTSVLRSVCSTYTFRRLRNQFYQQRIRICQQALPCLRDRIDSINGEVTSLNTLNVAPPKFFRKPNTCASLGLFPHTLSVASAINSINNASAPANKSCHTSGDVFQHLSDWIAGDNRILSLELLLYSRWTDTLNTAVVHLHSSRRRYP